MLTAHAKCRNAEPGTYNHECGKMATVTVTYRVNGSDIAYGDIFTKDGDEFTTYYCPQCWHSGTEAQRSKRLAIRVSNI